MGQLVLDMNGAGQGSVVVDGMDLSSMVRGLRMDVTAGSRPHIVLELAAHTRAVTEGAALTFVVELGPHMGSGTSLVEALERLTDAARGMEAVMVEPPARQAVEDGPWPSLDELAKGEE